MLGTISNLAFRLATLALIFLERRLKLHLKFLVEQETPSPRPRSG
jgi:hypothetical protein